MMYSKDPEQPFTNEDFQTIQNEILFLHVLEAEMSILQLILKLNPNAYFRRPSAQAVRDFFGQKPVRFVNPYSGYYLNNDVVFQPVAPKQLNNVYW